MFFSVLLLLLLLRLHVHVQLTLFFGSFLFPSSYSAWMFVWKQSMYLFSLSMWKSLNANAKFHFVIRKENRLNKNEERKNNNNVDDDNGRWKRRQRGWRKRNSDGNNSTHEIKKKTANEFEAMSTNRMIFNDAYLLMRKLQVMARVFMLMFKHSSAFLAITTFSFSFQ